MSSQLIKNILHILSITVLVSCGPSKKDIETKLSKGCEVAVKHLLNLTQSEYSYQSTKSISIERNTEKNLVQLTLSSNVLYREFSEEEHSYTCLFEENKNLINYRATLDYVEIEDTKYGRVKNSLSNLSISEFSTLNDITSQALR